MQTIIESLKKFDKSDFWENVNLHIHTNHSDGVLTPTEVINEAQKANLKLISITDHNSVDAYKIISPGIYGNLEVIAGVEFDCWYKSNFIHILGYGFDVKNEKIKELCAKNLKGTRIDLVRFFNKRSAKDVIDRIRAAGGIAVLAHPACCWNINIKKMLKELKKLGLQGIEVYYPYVGHRNIVKFYSVKEIKRLASELDFIITGGTDCHSNNIKGR
jgi:predicted metal-dependent phosphoesterase TrpH